MQDLSKLSEPNSPDRKNFSVHLDARIAIAFGPEEFGRLMNALPYKDVSLTIVKGKPYMCVIVPRDQVLRERHAEQEKPSIRAQLKDAAARQPASKRDTREQSKGRELL